MTAVMETIARKTGLPDSVLLRLKNIHRVRSKGRTYYYHRPTKTPLKSAPGSAEFVAEVQAAEGIAPPPTALPGTLGALITAYKGSDAFLPLGARTKADYQKIIDCLQPVHGMALPMFTTDVILVLRDELKAGRRWKNYFVTVIRIILGWGKPRKWVAVNAAADIEGIKRPKNARKVNRPWTAEEYATVMKEAPIELKTPIALGLFTGQRESDVVSKKLDAYTGKEIELVSGKTGVDPVWIQCPKGLKTILDAELKRRAKVKVQALTLVVGARGRPLTEAGFRANFFKLIRRLKKDGKVKPGLTFHGLRHTLATLIADDGGDNRDIMAMLGHTSERMAMHYAKQADRKRRTKAVVQRLDKRHKR